MKRAEVTIVNRLGLHARPSAALTQLATRFSAEVFLSKGTRRVNGKSIMGVMMLAAAKGSVIVVETDGKDEDEALAALVRLIGSGFGEELDGEGALMFTVFGTPIGGGIVTGRACVVESRLIDVPRYRLAADAVEAELERLELAVKVVTDELEEVAAHLTADAPTEARALLDVHIMILNDPALIEAAATCGGQRPDERRVGHRGEGRGARRAVPGDRRPLPARSAAATSSR